MRKRGIAEESVGPHELLLRGEKGARLGGHRILIIVISRIGPKKASLPLVKWGLPRWVDAILALVHPRKAVLILRRLGGSQGWLPVGPEIMLWGRDDRVLGLPFANRVILQRRSCGQTLHFPPLQGILNLLLFVFSTDNQDV